MPSFLGVWQYDDFHAIVYNQDIQITSLSISSLLGVLHGSWDRALSILSLAINYYVSGLNPFGYHIFNLLVHIVAGIGVYFLTKEVLRFFNVKNDIYKLSLLTAGLWILAPIQVTAVTYIVQRMASMAGMFYFWSLWSYLKWRNRDLNNQNISKIPFLKIYGFLFLAVLLFVLGFFSKQNVMQLVIIVIIMEIIKQPKFLLNNKKKVLLVVAIFFTGIIYYIATYKGLALEAITQFKTNEYKLYEFTPLHRLALFGRIMLEYLGLMIFPFVGNFHLLRDIDWINSYYHIFNYTCNVGVLISLFMAIKCSKKKPLVSFTIFFFFVNHLLESLIIPLHLVFDHRNYIPSFSVFLLLAYGLITFHNNFKNYGKALIALVLAFSAINTLVHNQKFQQNYCNAIYDYKSTYTGNSFYNYFFLFPLLTDMQDYGSIKIIGNTEMYFIEHNKDRLKTFRYGTSINTVFFIDYCVANIKADNDSLLTLKQNIESEMINRKHILKKQYKFIYYYMGVYFNLIDYRLNHINFDNLSNNVANIVEKGNADFLLNRIWEDKYNLDNQYLKKIKSYSEDSLSSTESRCFSLFLKHIKSDSESIRFDKLSKIKSK